MRYHTLPLIIFAALTAPYANAAGKPPVAKPVPPAASAKTTGAKTGTTSPDMNGSDASMDMSGATMEGGSMSMAGANATPPLSAAANEFFEKNIRPLLADKCYTCHSLTTGKAKGGLQLDTKAGWQKGGEHGTAIVPGKPDASLLLKAVNYTDQDLQMPPSGKLPDAGIAALKQWIAMGAPDPRTDKAGDNPPVGHLSGLTPKARAHWAFQPVHNFAVPAVKAGGWVKTPIDNFILAKLVANHMTPNPPASREALIRRATYDLTGLPPTVGEMKAFEADTSPDAFAKVVDRLLASPQYGERWARHWLDSARYSDTRGLISQGGKYRFEDYRYAFAWTYRDYVIKAFNDDKPYDQFLMEQIAADKLPDIKPNDPRLAALGFLTVGKRFENPDDTIDERIDTVTKATLGLTVACARCHDHKFDPIPTADYYSLHNVFSNITEPYDRPELPNSFDSTQRADFDAKLRDLETRNRGVIYDIMEQRLTEFMDSAEGYLMVAPLRGRSSERFDMEKKYNLTPENGEIAGALRLVPEHPVLGPFAQLMRLPAANFATQAATLLPKILNNPKRPINPLVVEMLQHLKPQSLDDVAKAYGALFAKAKAEVPGYFAARSAPGRKTLPVSDNMAEVINALFYIPPGDDLITTAQQMDFYTDYKRPQPWMSRLELGGQYPDLGRLMFPAINELYLTHPGAPGHAMIVADVPQPHDDYVYIRGDRNKHGPTVPRQFLEILSGPDRKPFTDGSGRLGLAQAIADPKNPLTARVLVNRVWMYHFGEGFVPTPDDLGNMSEKPTHVELLDWLSRWFMENGWSIKKLNRMIMLSSAYQESSASQPAYETRDPGNQLIRRANLRRLDFESIRDSMVLLTGKLDPTVGGKPVNITDEPYSYRRSIYGYVDRLFLSDLMSQFDFSDPDMANTHRISTIVPQQALFFMNSPMSVDVAREVTTRPEFTAATDDAARVRAIYTILFQRAPSDAEITWATDFMSQAAQLDAQPTLGPNGKPIKAKPPRQKVIRQKSLSSDKYAVLENTGAAVERGPLTPWQLYTQTLLCSNEFVYVN